MEKIEWISTLVINGVLTVLILFCVILTNEQTTEVISNSLTNQTIESYEQEIKELKQKKNTLMLICLEKGKKRPNKQLLDSLEISYYLD